MFSPKDTGLKRAIVSIDNEAVGKDPYQFLVVGKGIDTVTGISGHDLPEVKVFNRDNKLYIDFGRELNQAVRFSLFDMSGKRIMKKNELIEGKQHTLNTGLNTRGIYLLKMQLKDRYLVRKVRLE